MSSLNHMNDQNRVDQQVDLPHPDDANKYSNLSSQTNPATNQGSLKHSGTDVMGEPVNPSHQSDYASHTANFPAGGSHAPACTSPTSAPPSSAGNFPSEQSPSAYQTKTSQASPFPYVHTSPLTGSPTGNTAQESSTPNPYVRTSSLPGSVGSKTPMDSIMQVFNKWSKKAEDMTGDVWNHLRTGPNVAETALGRIALGTKAMTEGGLENIFRQTFEVAPEEHLLKTYACYLSVSTGPVAGTLYISSQRLAFCSDRRLTVPGSPPPASNNNTTNPPASTPTTTSAAAKSPTSAHQQHQWCYYKVMVPISQLQAVNPSENTQKKPPEKYVQVQTVDGHEFWFMGFVHYDKGVKNLQETLLSKNIGATGHDTSAAPHVVN